MNFESRTKVKKCGTKSKTIVTVDRRNLLLTLKLLARPIPLTLPGKISGESPRIIAYV